jgi:hypothetical protein
MISPFLPDDSPGKKGEMYKGKTGAKGKPRDA